MIARVKKKKQLNPRQRLFVEYYTSGETLGNCYQSMIKANYRPKYALKWSGKYINQIGGIREAVDERVKQIIDYKKATVENVDIEFVRQYQRCMEANDRTNAVRILENRGKNAGYYAADNAQKAEIRELDAKMLAEADKIAQIRLIETKKEVIIEAKDNV